MLWVRKVEFKLRKLFRAVGEYFSTARLAARLAVHIAKLQADLRRERDATRLAKLEQERAETAMKLMAEGYLQREHIVAGDLVIFRPLDTDSSRGDPLGHGFGMGWGAMRNLQDYLSVLAGGNVGVMASRGDVIRVSRLGRDERRKLRDTLDAADRGMRQPDFTLDPEQLRRLREAGFNVDEKGRRLP